MNNQFPNLSEEKLGALLQAASGRLGVSPETLRSQLQNGQLEHLTQNLNPMQAQMFNQLLQNPQQLEKTLASPQVAAMLKKLLGGR